MFTGKKSSPSSKHRRAPSVVQQQPGMQQPPLYDNPLPPRSFGAPSQFYDNPAAAALQSLPGSDNPYALGAASENYDVNPYALADDRGATRSTPPLYDNRPLGARSRSPSARSLNTEELYDNRSVGSRTPSPTGNGYLRIGGSPTRSSPPPLLPGQATYALASSDPTQTTYALASAGHDQAAYALASSSTDPAHAVYALATANPATGGSKARGPQPFYDSGQAGENEYHAPPTGFGENLYEDGNRAGPEYLAAQRAKENEYHAPPLAFGDRIYSDGNEADPDYLDPQRAKESLYHETTVDHELYATIGNTSAPVITKQPRATLPPTAPVAQYPDIECCSGDYQRCFHQHCGCLYLWSRERLSSWWQQQTYMGRSLLQCLFGCFGYNFAPPSTATSLYQEFPAVTKMMSVVNPLYGELEDGFELNTLSVNQLKTTELYRPSRLGCWQTVYAFLGCMGLSRPACIRWMQSHERWEINGRMRFGQLIVDSTCVALVVAVGPTLFFTPVLAAGGSKPNAEQSQTGGDYRVSNTTSTALTVPSSSLPPTSMAPGSTTTLEPVMNFTSPGIPIATNGTVTTTLTPTAIVTSQTTGQTTTTWIATTTNITQVVSTTSSTTILMTPNVTTSTTTIQPPISSSSIGVTDTTSNPSMPTTTITIATSAGNINVTTNATGAMTVSGSVSVMPTSQTPLPSTPPPPTSGVATTIATSSASTNIQTSTLPLASTGTVSQTVSVSSTASITSSTVETTTTTGAPSTTSTVSVTNPTTGNTVTVTSSSTITPIAVTNTTTVNTTPITTTAFSSSATNAYTVTTTGITTTPSTTIVVTTNLATNVSTISIPTTTGAPITVITTTTTTAPRVLCKDDAFQPCCPGVCRAQPRNPQCLIYC